MENPKKDFRILGDAFGDLFKTVFHNPAANDEKIKARAAFYAGASTVLKIMMEMDNDKFERRDRLAMIETLRLECIGFLEGLKNNQKWLI